jgi:hypothetical protein
MEKGSMATTSRKQKDIRQNLQAGSRAGDHEAKSRVFCQDTKNECQNIVEEPVTSEMEKETTYGVSAMDVGALPILGTFTRKERRKMMVINLDRLAPYEGTTRDEGP